MKSICEKKFSKVVSYSVYLEKKGEKISPTSAFAQHHSNKQRLEILAYGAIKCL